MTIAPKRLASVVRSARHRGLRQTGRLARTAATELVRLDASHLWYVLDVTGGRPRRELPEGVRFAQGGPGDADRLDELDTITPAAARERLAGGADLWMVLDDEDRLAFACWTYPRSTPTIAARGGWLELPPGVASLEDSVTSADHRGRGIAPAAWTLVADAIAERGFERLMTIVGVENVPSRRAVLKAGFGSFALTRLHRRRMRTTVEAWTSADPLGREIARRLPARPGDGTPPAALAEDAR